MPSSRHNSVCIEIPISSHLLLLPSLHEFYLFIVSTGNEAHVLMGESNWCELCWANMKLPAIRSSVCGGGVRLDENVKK